MTQLTAPSRPIPRSKRSLRPWAVSRPAGRRFGVAAVVGLCLAGVLASCGDGGTEEGDGTRASDTAVGEGTDVAPTEEPTPSTAPALPGVEVLGAAVPVVGDLPDGFQERAPDGPPPGIASCEGGSGAAPGAGGPTARHRVVFEEPAVGGGGFLKEVNVTVEQFADDAAAADRFAAVVDDQATCLQHDGTFFGRPVTLTFSALTPPGGCDGSAAWSVAADFSDGSSWGGEAARRVVVRCAALVAEVGVISDQDADDLVDHVLPGLLDRLRDF